ncbi:MAG: universal stress protein [Pirellulaceae bacterium]|nr:universal stress protein [Pirellulaceae bacterium]
MKILVPTAGKEAAAEIADYVIRTAKKLNADLVAMHILRGDEQEQDGHRACNVLVGAATQAGIAVETKIGSGDVVQAIIDAADSTGADMIVMGASKGTLVKSWLSADVMERCDTPVLVVPHCYGE